VAEDIEVTPVELPELVEGTADDEDTPLTAPATRTAPYVWPS